MGGRGLRGSLLFHRHVSRYFNHRHDAGVSLKGCRKPFAVELKELHCYHVFGGFSCSQEGRAAVEQRFSWNEGGGGGSLLIQY